MWQVIFHPGAEQDLEKLPPGERAAVVNAVEKLRALGPILPFPHQSDVRGVDDLRELRPRAGRSAWRGFYRRVGDVFVLAAIGSEAEANSRAFDRTVREALKRLDEIGHGRETQ